MTNTHTSSYVRNTQYMRYLSLWFGSVLGLSIVEFKNKSGYNRVELVLPRQLLMQVFHSNFGVNMVTGLYLKAQNGMRK
jgi:hypothetical protein